MLQSKEELRAAKTDQQALKIELEAEEVSQRLTRKWYVTRYLLEAVIAALVAAGLIAAWATQFLLPMLQSKEELRAAKTDKQALQIEVETLKNEKQRAILQREKEDIEQKYDKNEQE